jgi:hypothetical protein
MSGVWLFLIFALCEQMESLHPWKLLFRLGLEQEGTGFSGWLPAGGTGKCHDSHRKS